MGSNRAFCLSGSHSRAVRSRFLSVLGGLQAPLMGSPADTARVQATFTESTTWLPVALVITLVLRGRAAMENGAVRFIPVVQA